jgi:hypothetical protein
VLRVDYLLLIHKLSHTVHAVVRLNARCSQKEHAVFARFAYGFNRIATVLKTKLKAGQVDRYKARYVYIYSTYIEVK